MQRRSQTERGRIPKRESRAETRERERFTARVNSSSLSLKGENPSLDAGTGAGRGVGGRGVKEWLLERGGGVGTGVGREVG